MVYYLSNFLPGFKYRSVLFCVLFKFICLCLFSINTLVTSLVPLVVVQLLSRVWLFATPWTAVHQASLSFAISWSFLKLMSLESSDAIRPSHPLLPSSAPAFTFSQHFWSFPMSQPFAFGDQSIGATASDLPVNIQDWFPLRWLVWSPCGPRDFQESSLIPQLESINSLALSLL